MKLKKNVVFACQVLLAIGWHWTARGNGLTDDEIPTMLQERIDRDKMGVGIVVGILDEHGPRVFSYGKLKQGRTQDVNGDTLFEIGSITKVFTTLLLQDMVDHEELKLEDPIGKFLPASVKTRSYKERQITLDDLATHTSGLPRLPDTMLGFWYILRHYKDPYAGFGEKELYKFLSKYRLKREPGTVFEYSNLGMELLGQILSLKGGTNYESLVVQRICGPLKMDSTRINLTPELQSRFAQGHDDSEQPVNLWSSPLPADGAIRSSANDMLKFLSAEMGITHSPLSGSIAKTQKSRHATDSDGEDVGLGLAIDKKSGIIWHNGGTSGFRSYIGFDQKNGRGVVVLANSEDDVDDVGQILLGTRKYRKVATIDFNVYDQYVGEYKRADKHHGLYIVTRKGDRLFTRLDDQNDFEFYPESETHFFNNSIEAQLIFKKNESGTVTNLVLLQPGVNLAFVRVK